MNIKIEESPNFIELKKIDQVFADRVRPLLSKFDTGPQLLNLVSKYCENETPNEDSKGVKAWVQAALFLLNQGRAYEALALFCSLYERMLQAQSTGRLHKGTPLLWISECYQGLNFPCHAKRYLMLAHCEDALTSNGNVNPEEVGAYFRLAWRYGVSDAQLKQYAQQFYDAAAGLSELRNFPEALLQDVDDNWITELPSQTEALAYRITQTYVRHLLDKLGDRTGKTLERLASYLMASMPGCRTRRGKPSRSTDYDVVCAVEGIDVDFRSELGRYFVCECKDWCEPADFTTMAKFCRVLDSTKSRFGILFSKTGISGKDKSEYADREQLKVFQDRGIVIVVLDQNDLEKVASGANFIGMLREQYEKVRLDLRTQD